MRRVALGLVALVAAPAMVPAPASASRPPARLLVSATEFRLELSRVKLVPGRAIVQLANRGEDDHDLVIRRLDRRGRQTGPSTALALTRPGAVSSRSLTLRAGRYVLFCSLPQHARLGMRARLRAGG